MYNIQNIRCRKGEYELDHVKPSRHMKSKDVVLTLMRRNYVASAPVGRHLDAMCPLGEGLYSNVKKILLGPLL